jgi:predicted dehydrogenase
MVSVLSMAEVAADFIQEGIPAFMEKPPGLYTADTRRLAALARKHDTPVMVGVNRRFYSTMLAGRKRLLDAGPIRSITVEAHESIQRVRDNAKWPQEVLWRWSAANGIHALDQLRFFAGDVATVDAVHHTVEGPMPDCCTAILAFEQGAVGRALMDWFAPGGFRFDVRSVGATLSCVDSFNRLSFQRRDHDPELIELDELDQRYKAGFFRQDRTFLECVRDGKPLPFPACTLDDAVKTMELVDAVAGTGEDNA